MLVLGIDPGATIGLALIEVPARGRPRWVWHGDTRDHDDPVAWAMDASAIVPQAIAIEELDGYVYEQARGAALIKTARLEGRIVVQVTALGFTPVGMSRAQWRRAICGNGQANDARVKAALSLQVLDMPKRTNAHVRDAAGVAIVGARMLRAEKRRTA